MWKRALIELLLVVSVILPVAAAQASADAAPEEAPAEEGDGKEGEGDAAAPNAGAIYVPLKPALVVNYGGPGRLKYIKADISVRLQNPEAANSVRHHMPYIRNNLVMLFSAQTDESIASQEGKEALRREALEEVRNVILQEDQQDGVIDLYFNVFLIQK